MPVSVDPSVEACLELVDHINAGTAYRLDVDATYIDVLVDPVEEFDDQLRVDVVPGEQLQLMETLAVEDRTSHEITCWVRAKCDALNDTRLEDLKLLTRQIWQRLNDHDSTDNRVRVWECEQRLADKTALKDMGLYVVPIVMQVMVGASP